MANKKINQLVSKTSILGTDLFPLGDGTTGQLFKKTVAELQAAIGGAVISVNGLVGTVVLDTDDIQELPSPTNRYFTDARARGAISLTVSGASGASTYNSSTGVLNVPTYTLAGLGGITASFLSGGTGITYNSGTGVIAYSGTVYTDSSIRGLFSAGTGISYNSTTGAISSTITQYTDALARAAISGTAPITYNSTTGAIGITSANLTESTSSVLTITGGTGALLSAASIEVKQASGSLSGFLSSTDWTTFNAKQNALTNPVTGTGTTNFLPKWTSSSAIGNSVIQENSGSIGINGAAVPDAGDTRLQINATTFASLNLKSTNVNSLIRSHNTNGGFYLGTISNHFVSFFSNDTERMRISSAGNVGIGITSPASLLHIYGSGTTIHTVESGANFAILNLKNTTRTVNVGVDTSGLYFDSGSTGIIASYAGGSERMRVLANGSVGIGATSPSVGSRLEVFQATAGNVIANFHDGASNSMIYMYAFSTSIMWEARTSNNASFRNIGLCPSGGNILMGTLTDNGERLYVGGSIRATGTITANSDISLKKNLAKIENALEKVEQINGYTYEFKADDSKRHAGVIAQEIEGVLPEIVNKGADGILGVEYGNISALLIEAIKDLKKDNESLRAIVESLRK